MVGLPEEDAQNVQLVQELRQQSLRWLHGLPILDRTQMDPRMYVMLLNQASVQLQPPQDSTAFGRLQQDSTRGQRDTRSGPGRRTRFGCGGRHRFTKYECRGLKGPIQRGCMHLSNRQRLVTGTRDRPGLELPWLSNERY